MAFLTIFSTPKPFTNPHIATIQRNAIQSWRSLGSDVEVMLVGRESGTAKVVKELGLRYLPDVTRNEAGTPLISSIFTLARENSRAPLLAYVNADIVLTPEFVTAAHQVADGFEHFLMIGQRYDLRVIESLDFSPGWADRLYLRVKEQGRRHPPRGSDYFVYPRSCFVDLPGFAVGRAGWDNWMIYKAWLERWPIIDATPSVWIVHQDHDYSHLPSGQFYYDLPETDENIRLAGGRMNTRFTLIDANWRFEDGQIRPAGFKLVRFLRKVELLISARNEPPVKLCTVLYTLIYTWRIRLQSSRRTKYTLPKRSV